MNSRLIFVKIITLCLMWFLPILGDALALPQNSPVPGGVAHVLVKGHRPDHLQATFQDQPCLIVSHPKKQNQSVILVGLPLDANPGSYTLKVKIRQKWQTVSIHVQDKAYITEKLSIPDQRKVT